MLNYRYQTGPASSTLPVDAIQEFNTQENPKAEYGWAVGAFVNVGLKSGTNSLQRPSSVPYPCRSTTRIIERFPG